MLGQNSVLGVLGAGTMGLGIAQIALQRGHRVVLFDSQTEKRDQASAKLRASLGRLVEKKAMTSQDLEEALGRFTAGTDLTPFRDADFVIEAIVENREAKCAIFGDLENVISDRCIVGTNTSSLSITSLSSNCRVPTRFLGVHFFNPAPVMALVEIIPGIHTDAETVANVRSLIDSWGKTTVVANDTPGFIVNRIARPFYGEALRIYEEGIADHVTIDWAMREFGEFRMGPFELMDFIGNDVNFKVTETIFEAFYYEPRYRPSLLQKRLVEANLLGLKTKRGFYDYRPGAIATEPRRDLTLGRAIFYRVLAMLINEASDALMLGVATAEDLDLAMTKGVNYPKGLLRWADELGSTNIYQELERLYHYYGEDRYRPSPLLKKLAQTGDRFFLAVQA